MRHDTVPTPRKNQAGVAAVEFALVATIFLAFVFGALELARAEYMFNVLREVTRRGAAAAAKVDFKDNSALQSVRAKAVFQESSGPLPVGAPVTSDNVMIDYLSVSKDTLAMNHMTTLPSCPARNRLNCLADPYASNCIRFVRVRVCASMDGAGNCQPLPYQMLFSFLDLSGLLLPTAETIVPAGSLGYIAGSMPCP
jgi:hypothetical protein